MPTLDDLRIGQIVSFTSKSSSDPNHYYGKIEGFVTYDVAKSLVDVITYNSAVQTADITIPSVDQLSYVMIKLLEQPIDGIGKDKYMIPFAEEWIDLTSLVIIETNQSAIIKVHEITTLNVNDLLNYLRAGGYKVRLEKLT